MVLALIAAISLATGITRATDPALMELAQTRAQEIVHDFDHRPLPELEGWEWWGEVLARNAGFTDPAQAALNGWRNSPEHWAILTDRSLLRIGCGHVVADGTHYFACILARPASPAEPPPPPPNEPPPPHEEPPVLPDTALGAPT